MKHILKSAFLSLLLIVPSIAHSEEPEETAIKEFIDTYSFTAPDDENGTVKKWVETKVNSAGNGKKAKVEIPIIANYGWGCEIPSKYCIGFSGGGCIYLRLIGNIKEPFELNKKCEKTHKEKFCSPKWMAEGYFTGKTKVVCEERESTPESCCDVEAKEYQFDVVKLKRVKSEGQFNIRTIPESSKKTGR